MKRWERWALHLLTTGITGSGLAYFWMKHLLTAQDPFSVINHPWQPAMLEAHLLLSPFLIFLMGMILHSHIARKLRNKMRNGRRTGMLSLFSFPVMVLSGYGLQLLADPIWTQAFVVMHLASGAIFAASYAIHLVVKLRDQTLQRKNRIPAQADRSQPIGAKAALQSLKVGVTFGMALAWTVTVPAQGWEGGSSDRKIVQVERQVFLMGTRCRLTAQAPDRAKGRAVLESLLEVLVQTEAQLSTWRPESSLSLLNQAPLGKPFPLSASLCRLFEDLYRWQERTRGAFDPAIGNLIQAWGLRQGGRFPSPEDLQGALERSGLEHLLFDPVACQAARRRAVTLDAGAFGKGEALDRARLSGQDPRMPWMINLGGQIMVGGAAAGISGWPVDIARPDDRGQPAMQILLRQGSVAVSGGSERDLRLRGRRIGHVLDPRSGRPAAFSGSVAVWHPSALAADILSTALFVMGDEDGMNWARQNDVAACFLSLASTGMIFKKCSPAFRRSFGFGLEASDPRSQIPESDSILKPESFPSSSFLKPPILPVSRSS